MNHLNRVFIHLHNRDRESSADYRIARAKEQYRELKKTCEEIEQAAGNDTLTFVIPSVVKLAGLASLDDDDLDQLDADAVAEEMATRELAVRLFVECEPRKATLDEDLREYAVTELRRMACELDAAADRIEPASGEGCST